jgi:hypothetical protein
MSKTKPVVGQWFHADGVDPHINVWDCVVT